MKCILLNIQLCNTASIKISSLKFEYLLYNIKVDNLDFSNDRVFDAINKIIVIHQQIIWQTFGKQRNKFWCRILNFENSK